MDGLSAAVRWLEKDYGETMRLTYREPYGEFRRFYAAPEGCERRGALLMFSFKADVNLRVNGARWPEPFFADELGEPAY